MFYAPVTPTPLPPLENNFSPIQRNLNENLNQEPNLDKAKKYTLLALKVSKIALLIILGISIIALSSIEAISLGPVIIFSITSITLILLTKLISTLSERWLSSTPNPSQTPTSIFPNFIDPTYPNTTQPALINLALNNIKEIPTNILEELTNKINVNTSHLSVKFYENEGTQMRGIDTGGLGRELISTLFEELKNQKKIHPEQYEQLTTTEKKNQQEIWENIGHIMMFCYKSHLDYPIGTIFQIDFYEALKSLKNHELDLSLNNFLNFNTNKRKHVDRLLELYILLEPDSSTAAKIKQWLGPISALSELERKEAFDALSLDEDYIEDAEIIQLVSNQTNSSSSSNTHSNAHTEQINPQKLKRHFNKVQKAIKIDLLKPMIEKPLSSLYCIAKGMRALAPTHWSHLMSSNLSAQNLCDKIEGKLTKEGVINSLNFEGAYLINSLPSRTQNFLRLWINQAQIQDLRDFVKVITGGNSLKPSAKINITTLTSYPLRFLRCKFHTCFNQIKIPDKQFSSSEFPQFKEMLESSIVEGLSTPFGIA